MPGEHSDFDSQLHMLTDDARRAEAIAARRRRSDRKFAAALSGTFAGTLSELTETGAIATVMTRTGATVRGQISGLGPDVVIIQVADRSRVILRLATIEGLREPGVGHDRTTDPISSGPDMAQLLDEYTSEQHRIAFTMASGNRFMGRISRVGIDQVVITLDGDGESLTVPLEAIDHVVISQ